MRKKTLALFIMSTFVASLAMAQNDAVGSRLAPKQAVAPFQIGLFGGQSSNELDIDVVYAKDMRYSKATGYAAGVTATYCPKGWFSLHSGIEMVQKNWRMDRQQRSVKDVYTDATNNYLQLPITAELSVGRTFRVCGFFGGYVGYWLSGHRQGRSLSVTYLITQDVNDMDFSQDYSFNSKKDNRFEAGLKYGLALRCSIAKKADLSMELSWYYGLTNLQKSYMDNIYSRYNDTRTISFGVAYWL